MNKLYVHSFNTNMGRIHTAASRNGLAIVTLPGESRRSFEATIKKMFDGYDILSGGTINKQAESQLSAFLRGELSKFTIKLDLQAPPFHKRVLQKVAQIPYGRTMSYGEIARALKNPRAVRAVGAANARNKLPLVIPCHRVVAATGLGGYAGGLPMKIKLLKMEGSL